MNITRDHAPPAIAGVPAPAGARKVDEWIDETDRGDWARFFRGTRRGASVHVDIIGMQNADRSVERTISVCAPNVGLDAASARELGADLLAAADELDELHD